MSEPKDKLFDITASETVTERANSLTFDDKVVKKITGFAVNEVRGIIPAGGSFITGILRNSEDLTKGISVDVVDRKVTVDLKVICEYGQNIPRVFQDIVDKLTRVLKEMTGLDVVKVNVHVYDVLTKDEFERQNRKRLDERSEFKELLPEATMRLLEMDPEIEPDFELEDEPDLDSDDDMLDFDDDDSISF